MRVPIAITLLPLLAALACAPARPAPGMLAPVDARGSNEIVAADLATIRRWEDRRAALAAAPDAPGHERALERAAALLTIAHDSYLARPRATEAERALADARGIIESLETSPAFAGARAAGSLVVLPTEVATTTTYSEALCTLEQRIASAQGVLREAAPATEPTPAPVTPPGNVTVTGVAQRVDTVIVRVPTAGPSLYGSSVHFGLASHALSERSRLLLDRLVMTVAAHPELSFVIEGHADQRGDSTLNVELSRRRADAVRDYLERAGVASNRILVIGRGGVPRDAARLSARDHAMDRRAIIRLVRADGTEAAITDELLDLQIEGTRRAPRRKR